MYTIFPNIFFLEHGSKERPRWKKLYAVLTLFLAQDSGLSETHTCYMCTKKLRQVIARVFGGYGSVLRATTQKY